MVCLGWGHSVCAARLTCHLGIFRLMTRGAERCRLAGLSRASSRWRNASPPGLSRPCWSGGERARLGEGLAGDPQCGDETDPVRVVSGVGGCLGHQGADREVAAQVAPDLLAYQIG